MTIAQHTTAHVAVAKNEDYTRMSIRRAFRDILDRMDPQLTKLIRPGDHVLVKPFLRHGSVKAPDNRMTSHPDVIAMVIEAVRDCGAIVTLGDEGSKSVRPPIHHTNSQWIHDLAKSSGASLVSFAGAGASRVRSGILYPRSYLITRAVLDVDAVVSCANFQPHGSLVLSGAVKNMFNALVGQCQQHLHEVFPDPSDLARVIVDVCASVRPTVSFLDLTTVRDPAGSAKCYPVGLLLASTDPVALDSVAARSAGFERADAPTIRFGQKLGLGCADIGQITVEGVEWQKMEAVQVGVIPSVEISTEGFYSRTSRFINKVVLRPVPTINDEVCTGCGDCRVICPVLAIHPKPDGMLRIDPQKCAYCHLCIEVCEPNAIDQQFGAVARTIRHLMNRPLTASPTRQG